MYTIDFATILQLLREFQRNGILRAEVPSGLPGLKQPCIVVAELLAGEMVACYVKDNKGKALLYDQEAIQAISSAGKLNWVFSTSPDLNLSNPQTHPGLSSRRSAQTSPLGLGTEPLRNSGPLVPSDLPFERLPNDFFRSSPVPRHRLLLSSTQINAWPRRYRQVYVLIDGVRSVEKIAAMLSQSPQVVEEILLAMKSAGAITLGE